jgi:Glu-tRNA(Gln) amidotransferase subunit E-like FAD-binding protein
MLDYKKLGFKAGIEIHQQIEGKKLFCNCPTITNKKENPDIVIKRKIRAVAGESGKKDIAALYEEKKDKTFIYEFYEDCNCLIELDEEPPNNINQEALETAIKVSLLLKAKLLPKIEVMRKIVIDGSNVSGFQRTMLVAENGKVKTSKGIVNIPTILLEEEAAKKIATRDNEVVYRLDRLGIPLIEIGTSPDIKDPKHAKETAEIIGTILRSVENIKRGIGTIRQDVNVSIKNTPRIEIKGFQDLKSIPKIIEYETKRLIADPPKKGEVRKAEKNLTTSFLRPLPGEARMYPETDHQKIETKNLKHIKPPKLLTEQTVELEQEFNLQPELAVEIVKNKIPIKHYIKKYKRISPNLIAQTLVTTPKELRTRFHITKKLTDSNFEFLFENLNSNKIPKGAILEILQDLAKNKTPDLSKYETMSEDKVEETIEKIIAENQGAPFNALMGIAMKKLKNSVDGKKIAETIKKFT